MRNEESLAAAHRAYGHASAGGHTTELNTALVQLGIAYQMLGDIERSMQYLEQAHDLAEARGDRLMLARALNTMGVAWWLYRGELDKALAGFRRVLEIRREAGAKDREAECLANLANVLFRRGDFEAALETSEAALRVGRAAGWQYGISYVQLDQADVHCYLGEYARGQELIEEAERNLAEGDELGRAYLQLWQGRNIYCDLGRHELALPVLQESLQFMRSYDHYEEMIRALTALGACRTRLGDLPGARACLVEAHELSLAQQFPWQRSEIRYRLGLVALAEGRPDEAEAWAGSAQGAVSQGSAPDWQGPVQLLLARIARRSGAAAGPVASLYERSVELAEVRCRAVERAWVWREAGAYLAAYSDGEACGRGQDVLARAETWLAERGVPVLPGS
jgi:tetratricopeptide (TPR) repeat protein